MINAIVLGVRCLRIVKHRATHFPVNIQLELQIIDKFHPIQFVNLVFDADVRRTIVTGFQRMVMRVEHSTRASIYGGHPSIIAFLPPQYRLGSDFPLTNFIDVIVEFPNQHPLIDFGTQPPINRVSPINRVYAPDYERGRPLAIADRYRSGHVMAFGPILRAAERDALLQGY